MAFLEDEASKKTKRSAWRDKKKTEMRNLSAEIRTRIGKPQ
jgi:hypothetical protein